MKRLIDHVRSTDTSVKVGCEEGRCGACTVLVGDQLVAACRAWVDSETAPEVTTARVLASDPRRRWLLDWLADQDLFQCGYCAPGLLVAAAHICDSRDEIGRQEFIQIMNQQVCRCTGSLPARRVLGSLWSAGRADR